MNLAIPASDTCVICRQGRVAFDSEVFLHVNKKSDVLLCSYCGSLYLSPPISDNDIAACYPVAYHGAFSNTLNKNFIKGALKGRRLKKWRPLGRFLDVGCALGGIVGGVVHDSGWEGVGTEIGAETVQMASQLFPQIQFFNGTIEDLPAETAPFDLIYVNNVLEHVRDPEAFLRKAFSHLKSGGRLELMVPNGVVDFAPNRLLYKKDRTILLTKHGGHLFFFSKLGLQELFARVGFEVRSWKAFHFILALKSTGRVPGKLKRFRKEHLPSAIAAAAPVAHTVQTHEPFASPRPWKIHLHGLKDVLRNPFRYAFNFGYDYEIILEKPH